MTDNNEFEYPPSQRGQEEPATGVEVTGPAEVVKAPEAIEVAEAPRRAPVLRRAGAGGVGQNEMAGLVLLINTVLGGLGTLFLTTKSAGITLGAALLVLLITVVVLVVRRVVAPGEGPQGEDGRGGR